MGVLKDLRAELVAALAGIDGLTGYTHIPGRMALPGVFVMAGTPYLEASDTFGERIVRFGVVVAAQTADNNAETESTDTLLEEIVGRLEDEDEWLVESVGQPYATQFNNANALVIEIGVSTTIPAFTIPDN